MNVPKGELVMANLIDIFEPELKFQLEESSEVDGTHILGKVSGQFFVPNGSSRNGGRFYSEKLWQNVCNSKDIQETFASRRMFGTIGHDQSIDDQALLEGKMSHIVTNAYIKNGKGIGEALILNTPAGRILNTTLRAGAKLFVSSRGTGEYTNETHGKEKAPVINPDTYRVKTWDFVLDPGFLEANPSLVESLDKDLSYCFDHVTSTKIEEGDASMDKDKTPQTHLVLIESLTMEKLNIQQDLQVALDENVTLKNRADIAEADARSFKSQLLSAEAKIEESKKYEKFGTISDIQESINTLNKINTLMASHNLLNKGESVVECIPRMSKVIDDSVAMIEAYKALGSVEEITEANAKIIALHAKMKSYGMIAEGQSISEAIDDLAIVANNADAMLKNVAKITEAAKITALATEFNVAESAIKPLLEKGITKDEMAIIFKSVEATESHKKLEDQYKAPVVESTKEAPAVKEKSSFKTRGVSLMERFSK